MAKDVADQNGYLFYVLSNDGSMEFRWLDNYVLEWVIDDVLRHILRKKNVFIEKAKLQMNHFNAAVLKRKRYDHLNDIKGKL